MSAFIEYREPAHSERAFLFPGQGSQAVGMGRDIYEQIPVAREVFERADTVLGFPLSRLCFEGPEQELSQTRNAQPAIAVTSLALLRAAVEVSAGLCARPAFVAGHSLGEYAALIAAGALDFEEGIRLLRLRGELMQAAGESQPGTMGAVLGLDEARVQAVCHAEGVEICTDNAPGQFVIGGQPAAVQRALERATEAGAVRVVPLNVSGAFHSSLMQPAADGLRQPLDQAQIAVPSVPVVANCTAMPVEDAAAIRGELSKQVTSTVQWTRTMAFLIAQGITTYIEFGPGHVLTSIVKRMDHEAATINVSDAATLQVEL